MRLPLPGYEPRRYWTRRFEREGTHYVTGYSNRRLHRVLAPEAARHRRETAFTRQEKAYRAHLASLLPDRAEHLLDFGCGTGRFAPFLARRADRYVGVDLVPGALRIAPSLPHGLYVPVSGGRMPFPDGTFDCAVAITVFQHVVTEADFRRWTRELGRVLREEATVVLFELTPRPGFTAPHVHPRAPASFSRVFGTEPTTVRRLRGHWAAHYTLPPHPPAVDLRIA